jgi:hypothetical protein
MKRLLPLLLILQVHLSYCQSSCDGCSINFDDTNYLSSVVIDKTLPHNIWQIGRTHKPTFDTAYSRPKVIITDTVNPYPANNYSVFNIRNIAGMGDVYDLKVISGYYNVQTDSLHAYGSIDISPDNGVTWIDIIHDTVYKNFNWYTPKPVLKGNSYGWRYFEVMIADIGSVFNVHLGDTILYRYSFKSDSTASNLGGLMFDNFNFMDWVEGISEVHFKPVRSKLYPNPAYNNVTIEFENPASGLYQLKIYDIHSKQMFIKEDIPGNKVTVNIQFLKPGVYIYKLTNLQAQQRSWGKFVIAR